MSSTWKPRSADAQENQVMERRMDSSDDLFEANVEALTQNESELEKKC